MIGRITVVFVPVVGALVLWLACSNGGAAQLPEIRETAISAEVVYAQIVTQVACLAAEHADFPQSAQQLAFETDEPVERFALHLTDCPSGPTVTWYEIAEGNAVDRVTPRSGSIIAPADQLIHAMGDCEAARDSWYGPIARMITGEVLARHQFVFASRDQQELVMPVDHTTSVRTTADNCGFN